MTNSAVICRLKKQRLAILQVHRQTSNANTSIASLIERLVHNRHGCDGMQTEEIPLDDCQLHWNRVGTSEELARWAALI